MQLIQLNTKNGRVAVRPQAIAAVLDQHGVKVFLLGDGEPFYLTDSYSYEDVIALLRDIPILGNV